MMKRICAILLCLSLVLGLVACGGNGENPTGETNKTPAGNEQTINQQGSSNGGTASNTNGDKNQIDLSNKGVVICYGDSITEGMSMGKEYPYPTQLQRNLGEQIKVINGGVSGETSATIMARANVVEISLAKDISFKAGQSEVFVENNFFLTADNEPVRFRYGKLGNELSCASVVIDGKNYTLRGDGDDEYYLSRQDSSAALTLKKGAKAKFDYSEAYDKAYCTIVLMGANDSDLTADQLIERYKKIAASSEKFIAIIPHYGTDYTKEFTEAFGNATVNLREYCKEDVWKDYSLEKDKKDEYYMQGGNLSPKFSLDGNKGDCHLSALGYKVLAKLIYDKGVELGYWN